MVQLALLPEHSASVGRDGEEALSVCVKGSPVSFEDST